MNQHSIPLPIWPSRESLGNKLLRKVGCARQRGTALEPATVVHSGSQPVRRRDRMAAHAIGMIGRRLAHYQILEELGEGGMGVVYKAHDTNLDRMVAIKVLLPEGTVDEHRMRRFVQEAQAIAALNHPNIAQVYGFDESDGIRWLAMEFIDGHSLAVRNAGGELRVEQIVDIAAQIADALAEAHSRGIIHRDIKPGNIMLTPRGQVKVLDFGLAKVESRAYSSQNTTESLSKPGHVAGTLHYMSPEQCLGRDVDVRSDIFSAGAVFYYLATGCEAFRGDTPAAVHDGILNRTPRPPSQVNPGLPLELDRIIVKAMEKDPDLRYQTADDLCADLRRLKRDSDRAIAVASVPVRSRVAWIAIGILVVILAACLAWTWSERRVLREFHAVPLIALPGSESEPSFSPDGNQIAFSWNRETDENWNIYVKVVGAGAPLRLTADAGADTSPAWSPDGRHIAFLRQAEARNGFFLIPALGGLERKISDAIANRVGVASPYVAWTPDSKALVLADRMSADEPVSLFVLQLETGERRRLTAPSAKSLGDGSPAVSPDGKTVAFVRTASLSVQDIYRVPLKGGEPQRLTFDNRRVFGMAWNLAGGNILFTSGRGGSDRLWRISPFGGKLQPVPGITEAASLLAVSRQGHRLAFTRWALDTNVWRFSLDAAHSPRAQPARVISSTRFDQAPQYSPDGGRIAFASNRSGASEIWLCDRDGLNSSQLTSMNGPTTGTPHWSPAGRYIAFDSRPNGNPDIYIIGVEGGTARRLTRDPSHEVVPSWSRNGRWIYFASNRTGVYQIWRAPAEGGRAVQVTKGGGFHGHESLDGRELYYAKSPNQPGLWKVPVEGGEEAPVLESLRAGFWGYWDVTATGIYYVERRQMEGAGCRYFLRFRDFASDRDRQVLAFDKRPFNSGLAISPDSRWCLYTQVDQSDSDIMLVDDFR